MAEGRISRNSGGMIWEVIERQRRELLRGERQAAGEMVRAYGEVWKRIRGRVDALLEERAKAEAAGETVDAGWLYRSERLNILQRHVEGELSRFADAAEPAVVAGQQRAVEAARAHSAELVLSMLQDDMQGMTQRAGMSYEFTRLPFDAVQDLVGFTSEGSPLRDLLDELGPAASARVRDALTEGLATGQGPAVIARRVRKELGGNLVRALTISRTETLRAYREATRRSYQANDDIIDGWTWVCACTARSCASCWAMHGTVHPLSERLDDHPNGRCTTIAHLVIFRTIMGHGFSPTWARCFHPRWANGFSPKMVHG
jgi:SPP1 gp7 family putative phage head morphogenesis protein